MTVVEMERRKEEMGRQVFKAYGVEPTRVVDRTFLHEQLLRGGVFGNITVTMAGCGALGSWTSLFLAHSGIKNFRLIDMDKVEDHNLSTQFYGKWNLGQSKVQALATELYRRHGCRVEKHPIELDEKNAVALLQGSHLVICTFDNKKSREIVQKTMSQVSPPNITVMPKPPYWMPHYAGGGVGCIMAGMHGGEYYMVIDWAENFLAPEDPTGAGIDPCNYPLATSLAVTLSGLITETAMHYLITGEKYRLKMSMKELFQ